MWKETEGRVCRNRVCTSRRSRKPRRIFREGGRGRVLRLPL
jgi:hypothetical protein